MILAAYHFFTILLSTVVLPPDGAQLRGYASVADIDVTTDSLTTDLSWLASDGFEARWSYFSTDTATIENRGGQWRRYRLTDGDTLLLEHIESSRERTDFSVAVPPGNGTDAARSFTARGRRDMAFVYADSGIVTSCSYRPRTLIAAPGDTLRDCRLDSVSRVYRRALAPADTAMATVTETELTWRTDGHLAPLATVTTRTVHTDGRNPVTARYCAVFPPSLNDVGINIDTPPSPKTSNAFTHGNRPETLAVADDRDNNPERLSKPSLNLTDRRLAIEGRGPLSVTVCDIAGRVWAEAKGVDNIELDLSALPAGEYVVATTIDEIPAAQTIKIDR